ncbi:MAG: hypothetical protein ACHQ0J_07655 [Candidatus Dormibacterales bacterium]
MTNARNVLLVPAGLILMGAILLIVVLLRAQIALVPAPSTHQLNWFGPAPAAAAAPALNANSSSNSTVVTQQTIKWIGTSAPLTAPRPATQQPADGSAPAPGPARCPTQSGSGLPCVIP